VHAEGLVIARGKRTRVIRWEKIEGLQRHERGHFTSPIAEAARYWVKLRCTIYVQGEAPVRLNSFLHDLSGLANKIEDELVRRQQPHLDR
jgi:hypothetical protein